MYIQVFIFIWYDPLLVESLTNQCRDGLHNTLEGLVTYGELLIPQGSTCVVESLWFFGLLL